MTTNGKKTKNGVQNFIEALRAPTAKKDETPAPEPSAKDRELTMRISEALKDVLDLQGADEGKERNEIYGYTAMSDRIRANSSNPRTHWAMSEYRMLSLEQKTSVDRSMMGTLLLRGASSFEHILSYLALLGFQEQDAATAIRKDVWSDDQNQYVRGAASTCLTYAAGVYSYAVLAAGDETLTLFGPSAVKIATNLKSELGTINAKGEFDCFGFNRGFVFAKTVSEQIEQKTRGRKSRGQAEADMQVGALKNARVI